MSILGELETCELHARIGRARQRIRLPHRRLEAYSEAFEYLETIIIRSSLSELRRRYLEN